MNTQATTVTEAKPEIKVFTPGKEHASRSMVNQWPKPETHAAKTARFHSLDIASTIVIREDVLYRLENNYKAAYGRLEPDVKKAMEKGATGSVNTIHTWPDEPPIHAQLALVASLCYKLRKAGALKSGDSPEMMVVSGHLKPHIDALASKLDGKQE